MTVLLEIHKNGGLEMADYLVGYKGTSIHLSASREETLRILREINPDLVILQSSLSHGDGFLRSLIRQYSHIPIYTVAESATPDQTPQLTNFCTCGSIALDEIVHKLTQ